MFRGTTNFIPPFNQQIAKKLFVPGLCYAPDSTLLMTAVSLFHKRIPDLKISSAKVHPELNMSVFRESLERVTNKDPNVLSFIWVEHFTANPFPEQILPEGFTSLPKHEAFFADKLGQSIYIRIAPQWNTVMFFMPHLTMDVFHAVQCFMSLYFPNPFEDVPRTELETDLLSSLTKKTDIEYRRKIEQVLEGESIRRFLLRAQLVGFEKKLKEAKVSSATSRLDELERMMSIALEQYRKYCEQREEQMVIVDGLMAQADSVDEKTEFEEYLCENKNLSDIEIVDGHIRFIAKTFLMPYLPDDWDCMSHNGSIFRGYIAMEGAVSDPDDLKLLLDAIFSRNHTLKLRMCAWFDLNYNGCSVNSQREYPFKDKNPSLKHYIPNPHLNRHDCFGQNRSDILTCMADGDMIGAVECCINVAKRVNVNEVHATFKPFVDELRRFGGKCIVTPDGQELTPVEAVKYLRTKETENETDLPDGTGEE